MEKNRKTPSLSSPSGGPQSDKRGIQKSKLRPTVGVMGKPEFVSWMGGAGARRMDSHWYIVYFDQYVDQSSWDSCK